MEICLEIVSVLILSFSRDLEKASVLISSSSLVLVHVLLLLVPAHHVAHHVAHHPSPLLLLLVALHVALLHVALLDHVASSLLLLPPAVHLPLHPPLLVHPPVHAPALLHLHPVVHAAPLLPHHALLHALLHLLPAPMVTPKAAVVSTGH